MGGEVLREFDADLCDYILGQIRPYLRVLPERPRAAPKLGYTEWNNLTLPTWLGRVVAQLPPPLGDRVWAGVEGGHEPPTLDDAELSALTRVLTDPPMKCENRAVWVPFPALHRRAVECVPEIRSELTKQTAEEWAGASADFAAKLGGDGLPLSNGVSTVHDWLSQVRRLLEVMNATPSSPWPGARRASLHSHKINGRRFVGRVEGTDVREQGPVMLSPADISGKFSVSRSTTYAACRAGLLTHYRVPSKKGGRGKYLIKEADLLAWFETLKSPGGALPSASAPVSSRPAPASPFSELDPRRLARAWKKD